MLTAHEKMGTDAKHFRKMADREIELARLSQADGDEWHTANHKQRAAAFRALAREQEIPKYN